MFPAVLATQPHFPHCCLYRDDRTHLTICSVWIVRGSSIIKCNMLQRNTEPSPTCVTGFNFQMLSPVGRAYCLSPKHLDLTTGDAIAFFSLEYALDRFALFFSWVHTTPWLTEYIILETPCGSRSRAVRNTSSRSSSIRAGPVAV